MISHLLSTYTSFKKDSFEEIAVRAYLDVVEEHSLALALSYILLSSQSKSENGLVSALSLFGTIGVKFLQTGAILKMFGSENQEASENAYDRANPMSKYEIEQSLKKHLSETEYNAKIKEPIKVLGSASVKTVTLGELKSVKRVALMLKRDNVENQIRTNLDLAKRFIERLKHYSVRASNPLLMPLVEAIEEQIFSEIDFVLEVEKYKQAKAIVDQIQERSEWKNLGWTVRVPSIVDEIQPQENLFAVEAVEGVTAKSFFKDPSVPNEVKEKVGEIIVKTSLRMLFHQGVFDPERHLGNWLIDLKKKEVAFIDPGQLMNFGASKKPWAWDPRLTLARFLYAVQERNVEEILYYSKLMGKEKGIKINEGEVKNRLAQIFSSTDLSSEDLQIKILEELYRSGIQFNHLFTFGALKGLMVLSGSGYVSQERFKEIMKEEVKSLFVKKSPLVMGVLAKEFGKKLSMKSKKIEKEKPKSRTRSKAR